MKHLIIMLVALLLATAPTLQAQTQATEKPVETYNSAVKLPSNKSLTLGKLQKPARCVNTLLRSSKTELIMGEVGVVEKPVEKVAAKVDRLAKYENPKTITEHFVNNLLNTVDKVDANTKIPLRARDELSGLLQGLVIDEKEATKSSLFTAVLDKGQGYLDKGADPVKMKTFLDGIAQKYGTLYSKSSNPVDRTQFTAILQASVAQAVDSYLTPKKVVEANVNEKDPVKNASVPATQLDPSAQQPSLVEK